MLELSDVWCGASSVQCPLSTHAMSILPLIRPAADLMRTDDAGDGYTLAEQFGLPYTDSIGIPGVSADIPDVGTIGAVGEITASGDLTDLTLSLGIGACLGDVCDGQLDVIGSFLPLNLLSISGIDISAVAGNICGGGGASA